MKALEVADTGLGFECDKNIVGVIRAFNRIPGVKSICSREHTDLGHQLWIRFDCADDGDIS